MYNRELTTILTLRIPRDEHARIEALALAEDRSLSSAARRLISLGFAAQQQAPTAAPHLKTLGHQREES